MQWPDVGDHEFWRLRVLEGRACTLENIMFHACECGVKLPDPSNFQRLAEGCAVYGRPPLHPQCNPVSFHRLNRYAQLAPGAQDVARDGVLVQGSGNLLQQLYHESDLIGWGASIDFPCFMTVCAKEATPFDFASLIHRFVRSESASPLLLVGGASPSKRQDLRRRLKPLLLPAFSDVVKDIEDPDAVVEALWRHHEAYQCVSPPPALDEVNCRLHRAYDRLDVPFHLRQNEYSCQFHKRDPLMLLLTKEASPT